jgi:putative polyketide hydroxylase
MWLRRAGERLSTLDLYEKSFVLLAGSTDQDWLSAAQRVAGRLGVPLDAYRVGAEQDLAPEPGADWAELHGTADDGAVLVRPDGFVAWRALGSVADPERTLTDVLERVLNRR